jgi:carotenoid cleavage dioxygenase-like enzyme
MLKFPETPAFNGFFKPERWEADISNCEVDGEIPAELDGSFFRVQPDPQFPPRLGDDIAFNGDGAVSRFKIKGGRVDFRHRFARTDKFRLEEQQGHALFGGYRNPLSDDPRVNGRFRGTANTNAFAYGGKLLALKEDSPPVAMDPYTLETEGYYDFAGRMDAPTFTAHPKVDPVTGNLLAFSYATEGLCTKGVIYWEFARDGTLVRKISFDAPYYCMMHDFGVTQDYVLFHVVPIVGSLERLERGLPHFGFDTTMPVFLGVLPRMGDGRDIRWFKAPNLFASHVMNAFNDGTKIYFDTPEAKNNGFPFFPDVHGAPFNPEESSAFMTRWTVDMNSNGDDFEGRERLTDAVGEFPRIDDRYATLPYRYGWMLVQDMSKPLQVPPGKSAGGFMMNTLGHLDHATGTTRTWWAGPKSTLQEPAFVPRSPDSPEGDGWIVAVCNRVEEWRSDLLLFEAQAIEEGPRAIVRLPLRLRTGLHGNWHAAQDLGSMSLPGNGKPTEPLRD